MPFRKTVGEVLAVYSSHIKYQSALFLTVEKINPRSLSQSVFLTSVLLHFISPTILKKLVIIFHFLLVNSKAPPPPPSPPPSTTNSLLGSPEAQE